MVGQIQGNPRERDGLDLDTGAKEGSPGERGWRGGGVRGVGGGWGGGEKRTLNSRDCALPCFILPCWVW